MTFTKRSLRKTSQHYYITNTHSLSLHSLTPHKGQVCVFLKRNCGVLRVKPNPGEGPNQGKVSVETLVKKIENTTSGWGCSSEFQAEKKNCTLGHFFVPKHLCPLFGLKSALRSPSISHRILYVSLVQSMVDGPPWHFGVNGKWLPGSWEFLPSACDQVALRCHDCCDQRPLSVLSSVRPV